MHFFKIVFAVVMVAPALAKAETRVCAGETLYYSYVTEDVGPRPPQGRYMGRELIAREGRVLGKRDIRAGVASKPLGVDYTFYPKRTVFAKSDPKKIGKVAWSVYSVKLAIHNKSPQLPSYTEEVVCRYYREFRP